MNGCFCRVSGPVAHTEIPEGDSKKQEFKPSNRSHDGATGQKGLFRNLLNSPERAGAPGMG